MKNEPTPESKPEPTQEAEIKDAPIEPEHSYIELEERFDQHKLATICAMSKDELKQLMPWKPSYDENDPLIMSKTYLANSKNGIIEVKHCQFNSKGRYFAMGGISLQSLPRKIRHTIGGEFYDDIDMENAQPVILQEICRRNG